jgi:glutamate-5-semialdehyde dehydrogenase
MMSALLTQQQGVEGVDIRDVVQLMRTIGEQARTAYRALGEVSSQQKERALCAAAQYMRRDVKVILSANAQDVRLGQEKGLSVAMLDRLRLDEKRIESIAAGLESIASLPDPVGVVLDTQMRPNGLKISRVSVPLGVIGIIYEARPNVTADAGGLCLKSGNAAILRGGSESFHSSRAIVVCLHQGLRDAGLPEHAIQLVPTTDRAAVGEMLTMVGLIDVIVPRGGVSLTQRVAQESRIPTILHLDGNCHTYIHEAADKAMMLEVVRNAKLRRTGICGATESILIDEKIVESHLAQLVDMLVQNGCVVRGDLAVCSVNKDVFLADESDWGTEYLDSIVSIKTVSGIKQAIEHINRYGSHHTDAIITADDEAAREFMRGVDSAIVMHNASTQFADGGEFGMGAEIGISTGRLHARGPVGAAQLTTYKYVVEGAGHIRPV